MLKRLTFGACAIVAVAYSEAHSATYDCENQQVLHALKISMLCEALGCQAMNMEGMELSQWEKAVQDYLAAARQKDEAAAPKQHANVYFKEFYNAVLKNVAARFASAQSLILRIDGNSIDFNPRIYRYECEAHITYDTAAAAQIWRATIFIEILKDPTAVQMAQLPEGGKIINYAYQQELAKGQPNLQRTLRFSVQPSASAGERFLVTHKRYGIFEN